VAGRPSEFTQDKADIICERLALGESLRKITSAEDMPGQSTVFRWLAANEAFREQYTQARLTQADALFDEILDIADDGRNDWMATHGEDGAGWRENGEALQRSRLRIDARKWMAGKLRPKVYGEKIAAELSGPNGGPIETSVTASPELAEIIARFGGGK
jgi:hypothetical protein